MKALTIWQPWASLIVIGAKPYEFRSWKPPQWLIGQRIAIHAAARKVMPGEVADLAQRLELHRQGRGDLVPHPCLRPATTRPFLELLQRGHQLPRSAILATAMVGEPKRGDEIAQEFGQPVLEDETPEGFNWGWPLTDVRPLTPPYPTPGQQGLWDWKPSVETLREHGVAA